MKKLYIIIGLLVFFIFTLILHFTEHNDDGCKTKDYFLKLSFNGVVVGKFLDHSDHGVPIIKIKEFENGKTQKINFFLELSESYDCININDTLCKRIGSDSLFKMKNNSFSLLKKLKFECD